MRLIMLRTQRLKDKGGHHSYKRQGEVLFSGSQYPWRQGFLFFEYDNLRCYGVETVPRQPSGYCRRVPANNAGSVGEPVPPVVTAVVPFDQRPPDLQWQGLYCRVRYCGNDFVTVILHQVCDVDFPWHGKKRELMLPAPFLYVFWYRCNVGSHIQDKSTDMTFPEALDKGQELITSRGLQSGGDDQLVSPEKAAVIAVLHQMYPGDLVIQPGVWDQKLNEIVPVQGDKKRTFFANSGAEADENAVKIARGYTKRPNIIVFSGAFHGRTELTMTMTSKKAYATSMGPLSHGVFRARFPYLYRKPAGMPEDAAIDYYISSIYDVFEECGAADTIAAIVVEPLQGEGGFIPAPIEWVKAVRKICDENGILLVADEVQAGFCRTCHGDWQKGHSPL